MKANSSGSSHSNHLFTQGSSSNYSIINYSAPQNLTLENVISPQQVINYKIDSHKDCLSLNLELLRYFEQTKRRPKKVFT